MGERTDLCKRIENANGILLLRFSDDEWSRSQGRRIGDRFTDTELAAALALAATELYALIADDPSVATQQETNRG